MNEECGKEILKICDKYGEQMLKDCKGMSVREERKYIEKWQPIMNEEVYKVIEKYRKRCACCGKYTLDKNEMFGICSVCGWQQDIEQEENPNYSGGTNKKSLNDYKKEYINKKGAKK